VQQAQGQLLAAQAQVQQAEANNVKAQLDLERYRPLVEKDVISKQQFDATVATADADKAALAGAKASEAAAEDAVRIARDRVIQSQADLKNAQTAPDQVKIQKAKADQAAAQMQQAQAALAQAKLNLGYTRIVAPVNGIITKKSLEVMQNVSVGQNLMTLVSLDDIWITANFKETQLRFMRPGQHVKIHVDAYGRDYDGTVTQIGGATGSVLSLFPPENATGNYVKVVQRVPVRIDLTDRSEDKDHLLRPGLSVEPTVRCEVIAFQEGFEIAARRTADHTLRSGPDDKGRGVARAGVVRGWKETAGPFSTLRSHLKSTHPNLSFPGKPQPSPCHPDRSEA
jgi:membrane fusion protein (multidrug efflux system)